MNSNKKVQSHAKGDVFAVKDIFFNDGKVDRTFFSPFDRTF